MNAKAISEKQNNGGCVLAGIGVLFALAGLFFFWGIFLSPFIQSIGSGRWPQTDCEILVSEVEIHAGDDGNSYKPIVEYKYTVDGNEYFGDSPTFEDISARRKWAKGIVDKYQVGENSKCYYDPDDPGTSVLDRTLLWSFYAFALFPLIFVAIGVAVFGHAVFGWWSGNSKPSKTVSGSTRSPASSFTRSSNAKSDQTGGADGIHKGDLLDQQWSEPKRLVRTQSRWVGVIVMIVFAGFWNGLVGSFLFSKAGQNADWFETLFMIPFVLIGLLLVLILLYTILALFSPKIEIALSTGAVSPGESVDVAWEVIGKANKFKTLKIEVRGVQTAIYRRGTDTYTENETFELVPILQTDQADEMKFGSVAVAIPDNTMHTFKSKHNHVKWEVRVHGDIPWWPNVKESFEFRVRPV